MSTKSSRSRAIRAIVVKDLRQMAHDRFWVFMTLLAVFWLIAVFYLLPEDVNETITIGVHQSGMDAMFDQTFEQEEGVEFVEYDSTAELEAALGIGPNAVSDTRSWTEIFLGRGDKGPEPPNIGIDFPDDFLQKVASGDSTTVRVYVDNDVPEEVRSAMSSMVRESGFKLSGNALPVTEPDEETIILGVDRIGDQLSYRDRLLPLLAFMMLLMETMALGTLIASEVSSRTVTAILVTPAKTLDFLAAKGIAGTSLAFVEVMVIMAVVGAFVYEPVILTVALFLGAVLVSGVALLIGSAGRDFVETIFMSMLFLIPMMIPAIAALFPGSASTWVTLLPTYGLVETIMGVTSYGAGWSDVAGYLAVLAAWCVVVFAIGLVVLKRKVESL